MRISQLLLPLLILSQFISSKIPKYNFSNTDALDMKEIQKARKRGKCKKMLRRRL